MLKHDAKRGLQPDFAGGNSNFESGLRCDCELFLLERWLSGVHGVSLTLY